MPTPRRSSTRALQAALVVAAVCAVAPVRADGVRFAGDLPDEPFVLVELTAAQRSVLRRAPRDGPAPEVRLTPEQRDQVRRETGAEVPWVFAARREQLEGDCTCGEYNLAVVAGARLAVLLHDLGDHPSPREIEALRRALVLPSLPDRRAGAPAGSTDDPADPPATAALARAASALPRGGFPRAIPLLPGWRAQRVRLAAVPGRDEAGLPEVPASLGSIELRPARARELRWPELGSRRDEGGRTTLLVPAVLQGEIGPAERAWFVLEYEDGRIRSAAALGEATGWRAWTFGAAGP